MMAEALPSNDEHGSMEGRPTVHIEQLDRNESIISLPPPPPSPRCILSTKWNAFDFDEWLQSNNFSHLKQLFITHNMSTFETITTNNIKFASLISSPLIIQNNLVSDVVIAIQKLHSTQNPQNGLQAHDNDNYIRSKSPSAASTNTEYIVVSNDEHNVLTSLKQSLFEMAECKNRLKQFENDYVQIKDEIRQNKTKYIEKCKEKINLTFWNLAQIIENRQQQLLNQLEDIRIYEHKDGDNNNNNTNAIAMRVNEINTKIKQHEEYINEQINEYKLLIETTKTKYDAFETLDSYLNVTETQKVRVRRHSIMKMGNDSKHLHKNKRLHILRECEKVNSLMKHEALETHIDFVLDDEYFNKLLIYMQHSFGFIVQNIAKPSIQNVYFNEQKENLSITVNETKSVQMNDDNNHEYEIMHYEVAYFVKYDRFNHELNEIIVINDDNYDDDESIGSKSSGSSLFSNKIATEGTNKYITTEVDTKEEEKETSSIDDDIAWKFIQIAPNLNVNCKDIEYDLVSHSLKGELRIKLRSYLLDKHTAFKFWSIFSNDFVINLDEIETDSSAYGSEAQLQTKGLPKFIESPETSVVYHEEEDDDDEKREYFEKYYNLVVSDPITTKHKTDDDIDIYKYDEIVSAPISPMFSVNPLSGIDGSNILKENDENNELFWNDIVEKDLKHKKKKKKKRQRSWGQSLNRLFTSNSSTKEENIKLEVVHSQPIKRGQRSKLIPFKKRVSLTKRIKNNNAHHKSNSLALSNSVPIDRKKRKKKKNKDKNKIKNRHHRSRSAHMNLLRSNNDEIDTYKILLLGASDGGKTSVFKQIRHLNGDGFDKRQRKQYRILIISQILDSFRSILDKMEEEDENNTNVDANIADLIRHKWSANEILKDIQTLNEDNIKMYKKYLLKMWHLKSIQNLYKYRRNDIENISDSIAYFMTNLNHIFNANYIPNIEDILFVRTRSSGVNKCEIHLNVDNLCVALNGERDKKTIAICDVGGAQMERKKWKYHFIGVTAVFYVVALSGFDEKCFETGSKYKLQHELNVFHQFINCKALRDKQWILFLNKVDLFAAKLKREKKSISICFPKYQDDDDGENIKKSIKFISKEFSSLNKSKNKLYIHVTCATDQKFMKKVVDDTLHIIINNYAIANKKKNHLML